MDPRGKVAIVTGGASGIGRASAFAFAEAGAAVVVADTDAIEGERVVEAIVAGGGRGLYHRADVTAPDDVHDLVVVAQARFGGLDILHNNAGVPTPQPRYPDGDAAGWERTLAVNLHGTIALTQAAVPAMRQRGGGAIVNTASDAGLAAYPLDPVYAATKHGVVGFTRSLAFLAEEAGIRVNCVCPGFVRTPMVERGMIAAGVPERRRRALDRTMLPPEEVAAAVLRIVRDDAMAGEVLLVVPGKPARLVASAATLGDR